MKLVSLAVHVSEPSEWICRFSSYDRMLRVVAWMRRFIGRCRRLQYVHTFLQRSEIQELLIQIVRTFQRLLLSELYTLLRADQVRRVLMFVYVPLSIQSD